MAPELYEGYPQEHVDLYGPFKKYRTIETERHVYTTPFMHHNVKIGNYYAIGPEGTKGMEFKADEGFIKIEEEKPIMAVTVVGSGCVPKGYNIVEYEDEQEKKDIMDSQFPKRQRVDNLNGIHLGWLQRVIMRTIEGDKDAREFSHEMAVQHWKNLTNNYYKDCCFGVYENTAYFRIGPPYPKEITIRSGCEEIEDPGTPDARYPGDYTIRVVETLVIEKCK